MRTLLLLWHIGLLCSADSNVKLQEDPAPFQVEFHSVNFRNVLHWKHNPRAADDLQYFVEYKVYGDKQWSVCETCQAIHELQCDLSQETSDPRQWYYARVQARSSRVLSLWVVSSRFYPQLDTTFSPPKIKLNVTEQGIVVLIRPPRTPLLGRRNNKMLVTKLLKLIFRIYLMHNGEEQIHEVQGCSRKLLIEDLNPRTVYCVEASTVMPLSGLTSSRSQETCISTL